MKKIVDNSLSPNLSFYCAVRLGNWQQGFPIKFIGSMSFKSFSIFKKKETLAVRFTRLLNGIHSILIAAFDIIAPKAHNSIFVPYQIGF
jgi:hypothetical protein